MAMAAAEIARLCAMRNRYEYTVPRAASTMQRSGGDVVGREQLCNTNPAKQLPVATLGQSHSGRLGESLKNLKAGAIEESASCTAPQAWGCWWHTWRRAIGSEIEDWSGGGQHSGMSNLSELYVESIYITGTLLARGRRGPAPPPP